MESPNPFRHLVTTIEVNGRDYNYYDLSKLEDPRYGKLPFSVRVLLESCIRNCDEIEIHSKDVEAILNWNETRSQNIEIPFKPARAILQDFTGLPAVVDLAAMRDAVKRLGGDPTQINPVFPADLIIDHSVEVAHSGSNDALKKNHDLEFHKNKERFQFLKWGSQALKNFRVFPPASGIMHQVNIEYLARVVFDADQLLYPDSLIGTDSHSTLINGMGVLGWGVGGIEADAIMLGHAVSMVVPEVIGYKMTGKLSPSATSTDVLLAVTKDLREFGVVGKFVEFFGPGIAELSLTDRASIASMAPEYGSTVGFFPIDVRSIDYLRQTGRDEHRIKMIEKYLKAVGLFRDFKNSDEDPTFSTVLELDLSTVVPSCAGPKRPQDNVPISEMKEDFLNCLSNRIGNKGFGLTPDKISTAVPFNYQGTEYELNHGSVVVASITSSTNTINPSVMLGAGLLAKKAVELGLSPKPYIKTSLSPGSSAVTSYLQASGMKPYLEKLGFNIVGYACMTSIGNSGPLPDSVKEAMAKGDLITVGIISGNRNYQGRVHALTRANYLTSPPLVVAYALAGTMRINLDNDPIGTSKDGNPVYLKDIWPSKEEIQEMEEKYVTPAVFNDVYSKIHTCNSDWNKLEASDSMLYPWDEKSTYIKSPPFFDSVTPDLPEIKDIKNAAVLLYLEDAVNTGHISPGGSIAKDSPAAKYLTARGLTPEQFNFYGSRRGNDAVVTRGAFAHSRLVNKLLDKPGPKTKHFPSGDVMAIFDAAERYQQEKRATVILAGKEYGSGSSRDWAAKGPWMLGVRAVIAESYERIHRSNLVGIGVVPLQFQSGENSETLQLTGGESYSLEIPSDLKPCQLITVKLDDGRSFQVICRFDTDLELLYYRNGGILNYMVRKILKVKKGISNGI